MHKQLSEMGISGGLLIVFMVAIFFVASAIFMVSYNYCVPKLLHSVNKEEYDINRDFAPIDFWTACVTVIFLGFLVGNVYPINQIYMQSVGMHQ